FAHWYPRSLVARGRFDYERRGGIDREQLRFFTRASFERLVAKNGFAIRRRDSMGLPLDTVRGTRAGAGGLERLFDRVNRLGVTLYPSLFAYHLLFELEPVPEVEPAVAS